ncbi:peptidoglycan-binding domain-containing protein [Spirillospora sp. NPDC029432]|uniref:peptidoglycan-binding domain-containing protein n=1 Tax=Spirillospora sp. NPDC029432 TaxID=3154599 RepID=UPI003452AE97
MRMIRIAAGAVAALALLVMAGVAGAGVAAADGPDTPPGVKAKVEALDWPVLTEGAARWEVIPVKFLLDQYGYMDVGTGTPNNVYDAAMAKAVTAYQKDKDLAERKKVGPETWEHLRLDFGEIGPGKAPALKTKAVQRALNEYGNELVLDGVYGTGTKNAVVAFQKKVGIGADGWVGKITFRALICGGV